MSCHEKNPLVREGTSLVNRVLPALSPGFAKVDERDMIDLSLFAKRYAAFLKYFDSTNTEKGNWQPLIEFDVSVILASLARVDASLILNYKKLLLDEIRNSATDADAKRQFKYLFDLLFSLVKFIDHQFQLFPGEFEFKDEISHFIAAKLNDPLANLENYFNEYKGLSLLDYTLNEIDPAAPIEVTSEEAFTRMNLSLPWQGPATLVTITLPAVPGITERIIYVVNHNIFNSQIELLLNGVASLSIKAAKLFDQTVADYPQHSPHMALFLAWLKLFAHEQDALNTYTKRHLDFYYKEVLQLINKAPEPDSAHLVFELQKPVLEHRLQSGILFKGGKDVTGKEISYQLTEDIVLNKASVSSLKSWQSVKKTRELVKTYPIANSEDGEGAKLSSTDKSWFSFGNPKSPKNGVFGFAIASNTLYLNEGERIIRVTAEFAAPLPGLNFPALYDLNCFTAQYTGTKKWLDAPVPIVQCNAAGTVINFTIVLTPDAPALAPYLEKTHAKNLGITTPVLNIYLDQNNNSAIPYSVLSKGRLTRLTVNVGVIGVHDLMLSHDGGAIDASKPFKPFGDFPGRGAGLYIGSKEVFQKKLNILVVSTNWKTASPNFDGSSSYLRQNIWGKDQFSVFNSTAAHAIYFSGGNHFTPMPPDYTKNETLTANTLEGFIQLRLSDDSYSLDNHMAAISTALSATKIVSTDDDPQTYSISVPKTPVPVEIVLNSLSVNYEASTDIVLSATAEMDNDLLLQLSPFGFKRVSASLVDPSPDTENINEISLLPDFSSVGELFVGIVNAEPKQVLNLLFQVAEGSSNPLRNMEELKWYYLSANNNWKVFKSEALVDRTENLTQSGIVTLTLPADSTNRNSILDDNTYWIKLTADPFADAVCKLILVQAQASRVELVQDKLKQIEFRQTLLAKSISKLVVSDASLKSTDQPFDSFNGRTRETDEHFYVRVSERLRHKQRAITIWDYEHIILEKFQKIFKVKCINHAGFYPENGNDVFCENFPGHVSIITIPNLQFSSNVNPLRPYTPIGWLVNISDYLKTITSPFVQLHVKNPAFEEIQLEFKVKFYEHLSEAFYLDLLNKEIEQFLCPWAFDNKREISFGGKMYKSAVLNFVEERPYVDFVTCFKMHHYIERDEFGVKVELDVEVAEGSTARSILVSYYDEDTNTRHLISSPADCTC